MGEGTIRRERRWEKEWEEKSRRESVNSNRNQCNTGLSCHERAGVVGAGGGFSK